ncbi:RING-type domain-containing protein [Favolaschia claudopus]|uniref:RING-type domain-containing protein n=1 Tax=Favolaschia claudopus TaxID=2862362 RepID=A0AAW0CXU0_9AGAR
MPQRADPGHIAPYLTHVVTHHGQVTLVPPDNNGRRRKERQPRSSRNPPREEPVRFSSGAPSAIPVLSDGRSSRRSRPFSRVEQLYNDSLEDIPNYPPPSFLEAMASPPVSVCPSTTTLAPIPMPGSRHDYDPDSGSESDYEPSIDTRPSLQSRTTAERSSVHSRPPSRGRGILDSDPDDAARPSLPSSYPRSHRRHLSLSPLRTLFPSRSPRDTGHALSAQSTPSSNSLAFSRSTPFFRSTTSLGNFTSTVPASPSSAPSLRSERFPGTRRLFSHKGKEPERACENLDSWEIVESELPAAYTPLVPRPVSPDIHTTLAIGPPVPPVAPTPTLAQPHPLSEQDRRFKYVSPTFSSPHRERERRVPPAPLIPAPLPPGETPPLVTVRTKKGPPPLPPKRKPHLVPSPLREADGPHDLPDLDLDRALRTPLPLTPLTASPTSSFSVSVEQGSSGHENADPFYSSVPTPTRSSSSSTPESTNANVDGADGEGQGHHHYPGRPLPPWPRMPVDSTYAPHPAFPQIVIPRQPNLPEVPEGLLIDLDAVVTPTVPLPTHQSVSALDQLAPIAPDMQRNSSASSVDLAPSPTPDFMDTTDLDVLLARLEHDHHDGANYDDLWMVSDFIGPATPVRANRPASAKTSVLLTGAVEVQRRRTTKDGRVKLKLALLGIAVDRCGICMTQFKKAERARLSERCKHAFHDRCLGRWVVRSQTCPLCRIGLDLNASDGFR